MTLDSDGFQEPLRNHPRTRSEIAPKSIRNPSLNPKQTQNHPTGGGGEGEGGEGGAAGAQPYIGVVEGNKIKGPF